MNYIFIIIQEVLQPFSKSSRQSFFQVILANSVASIIDIFSVALIVPLVNILAKSGASTSKSVAMAPLIGHVLNYFDELDNTFVAGLFIGALALSAAYRGFTINYTLKKIASLTVELSKNSIECMLKKDYLSFSDYNKGFFISLSTKYIDQYELVMLFIVQIANGAALASLILISLILFSLQITIVILLTLSIAYIALSVLNKRTIQLNSISIASDNAFQAQIVSELLSIIADVLIANSGGMYVDDFINSEENKREALARNKFIETYPRYFMEALIVSVLLISVIYTNSSSQATTLTSVAFFAFSSQKLLPAIQQMYSGWSGMKSNYEAVKIINSNLVTNKSLMLLPYSKIDSTLRFKFSLIEAQSVDFGYPGQDSLVYRDLNFKFAIGEHISIIGESGSGKSTFVGLLTSLIKPTSGVILVNNKNLVNDPQSVQDFLRCISYVPQLSFFTKRTILENITMKPLEKISTRDKEMAVYCSKIACIFNCIDMMPKKYYSVLGVDSCGLSGGQRQRLCLARSLFRNGSFIILDEATSALDKKTQQQVLTNIYTEFSDRLILTISHDPNVTIMSSKVYKVKHSQLLEV